jgi:putative phosphoribosyl transferase
MLYLRNREQAGRQLGLELIGYTAENPIVLGIPRGGVAVAFGVARALKAPLDVFISQKLGVPGHEELAFGALAEGSGQFVDQTIMRAARVTAGEADLVTRSVASRVRSCARLYRNGASHPALKNQFVILIDDGIATGATMHAALTAIRALNPRGIVAAAPVASKQSCEELTPLVDRLVVLQPVKNFYAVGKYYEKFPPMTDEDVVSLLRISRYFIRDAAAYSGGRPAA